MAQPGIDLHSHTTASDGSLSPTELVKLAASIGLAALGVTDHDTIEGLAEATLAASKLGLELIPGVELSVEDPEGRYHLLGYGFNPDDTALASTLVELRARRAARNERIIGKAQELGLPIVWDDVRKHAGDSGEVIARPHFAAALVEKGVASSIQDAFDRYLATGQPLYFPKDGLTTKTAADLIHAAGGAVGMAHPALTKWAEPAKLEARLTQLRDEAGLDGVEAYYNKHTAEQTEAYVEIANRLGLLITGGSDFHGTPKPTVKLGDVTLGNPLPLASLSDLKVRLSHYRIAEGAAA